MVLVYILGTILILVALSLPILSGLGKNTREIGEEVRENDWKYDAPLKLRGFLQ